MEVDTTTEAAPFECLPHDEFCRQLMEVVKLPAVKGTAHKVKTKWTDPEDMISEAVIKAIENREKFRAGTNLSAWFCFILRNAALTKIRKHGKREFEMAEGQAESIPLAASAHHTLELKEVLAALHYMSRANYTAFDAVVLQEMTYEEAAIHMNIPIGSVKSRVSRGQTELFEYFGLQRGDQVV
jgi:RNA polymerase sigma-70 factor (ECF subfamily)